MGKEAKTNHKEMRSESPAYVMQGGEATMHNADLKKGGALIVQNGKVTQYARGPVWRAERDDQVTRTPDVRPVRVVEGKVDYANSSIGSELELFAWNPNTGDLYPVMSASSPIPEELEAKNGTTFHEQENMFEEEPTELNFSAELMEGQIELNFAHSPDLATHAVGQFRAMRKLTQKVEGHGMLIVPIATLPHRPLEIADVNKDPYVQRMALDHMGWERAQHFTGSSFQSHVEITDSVAALQSINYLQQLTPFSLAISAAGPFKDGRINLSSNEIHGIKPEGAQQWHSTRFDGRFVGSPSGGVITHPAPDTLEEFWEQAHTGLANNEIPTPARVFGHHADFRFRPDIGQHGTVEFAVTDSFAGHPKKMIAAAELHRAEAIKIQSHLQQGKALPSDIFTELDDKRLDQIHQDSYAVSRDGMNAVVHAANGEQIPAQEQFNKVLGWLQEPEESANFVGLSDPIVEELKKSAKNVHEELFQEHDPSSSQFLDGYYETGLGTASQWLHRRADELLGQGLTEEEAIKKCTTELGQAFHKYLQSESLEQELIEMCS